MSDPATAARMRPAQARARTSLAPPAAVDPAQGYAKKLLLAVSKYDLTTHDPREGKASHVSDASSKQRLRAALLAAPKLGPLLRALQRLLDYPASAPVDHDGGAGDALATTLDLCDDVVSEFWADFKGGQKGVSR